MKQSSGNSTPACLLGKSLYVGHYYVTVQKKLGEGGFATIYQAVHRHHNGRDGGQFFALKHFRINGDLEKLSSVKRECLLMNNIKKHPNIVTLYAACFAGSPIATDGFFLMELCHQDLVKALTANHRHMTEADILGIFLQIAKGVSHMHSQSPPLAHWDLKAENVLQSLSGSWVVCDFGSATTIDEVPDNNRIPALEDTVRRNTTAAYRAPELYDLHNGHRVNTQVDIFALGVLLYLMCFSKFPFQADAKAAVLKGNFPMPPSRHRAETCQLVSRLLIVDPARRPNIHDVIAATQSLLASPGALPVSPAPAVSAPQPVPPMAAHIAPPHAAMATYPPAGHAQPHSPAYGHGGGYLPAQMGGHTPGSPAYGSASVSHMAPPPPPPGGAGFGDGGLSRFEPYTRPVSAGAPAVNGAAESAGAATRDPFAASDGFDHGTGSRGASMRTDDDGQPLRPAGATASQTTASAPVSPMKRAAACARQQPFAAGAHTSDGVRKPSGETPAGEAAAAAEVKQRVLPGQHYHQPEQVRAGDADGTRARAAAAAAAAPSSPALRGAAGDADGGAAGSQGVMQSFKLTSKKVKAAAYVAMSGADGTDPDGDVDELASALSGLRMENERLKAELAARMAQGSASTIESGGAGEAAKVRAEAEKALQEKSMLERQLRTTQEELDRRRLQIGEMRSIIDAINTAPPPAEGSPGGGGPPPGEDWGAAPAATRRSSGPSPKKNGNSVSRQQTGFQEVSQRVMALLSETAGWKRRGLRRSVSEVHVAWSDFDDDGSPLHP